MSWWCFCRIDATAALCCILSTSWIDLLVTWHIFLGRCWPAPVPASVPPIFSGPCLWRVQASTGCRLPRRRCTAQSHLAPTVRTLRAGNGGQKWGQKGHRLNFVWQFFTCCVDQSCHSLPAHFLLFLSLQNSSGRVNCAMHPPLAPLGNFCESFYNLVSDLNEMSGCMVPIRTGLQRFPVSCPLSGKDV